MLYFLDTNIIIYAIEGQLALQHRARSHLSNLEAAGHRFLISELTWTECLVIPFRMADAALLLDYQRFLLGSNVAAAPLAAATHHRAAMIRAIHGYRLADSLHLACAVENRCDRFLTNDQSLVGFPDLAVELLP